ncbi:hypothetical protein GUITHDRAFT_111474 [Guillardia theta CCMP2712]|uniref:Uncharacterized protein n=2 Tax=Guillardia theta TaxID=55529 RepID=L1J1V7_GUITC|nr:hypothetical protein GUITHDRAFT_111474 [Guillardia theta CCMP2712]EKX42501.1 hypothetical protein GUITHDRAFT_111474 [Guillardia theta CCMP2712]|mmetsp:Transcript_40702/g.128308  ORF Transcript_40702/g.128308 Transcript_40702/m.128308 type:complete len:147 (+) Transcript_40702:389-829(+)|eukprot:XP_005829481.1 hypothetical protein GUITHDRAFT_111474 [Guillardia theta CCMP2712]
MPLERHYILAALKERCGVTVEDDIPIGMMNLSGVRPFGIIEIEEETANMFNMQVDKCMGMTVDGLLGSKTGSWIFSSAINLALANPLTIVTFTMSCPECTISDSLFFQLHYRPAAKGKIHERHIHVQFIALGHVFKGFLAPQVKAI